MPKYHYPPKHLQTPEWDAGLTLLAEMLLRAWLWDRAGKKAQEKPQKKRTTKR